MHVEERVEYHTHHRDGYTPRWHMHREKGDNLLPGFIKFDTRSKS